MERINLDETLVIATADHSHAFSIMGYPPLNNPILGFSEDTYSEKTPKEKFPTLVYGAGPGVKAGIPPENANKDFQGNKLAKKHSRIRNTINNSKNNIRKHRMSIEPFL